MTPLGLPGTDGSFSGTFGALDPEVLARLPRPQREEVMALLEEWAIKVPAENSKAIPVSTKDEAEARPLDLLGAGKADAYDAALTALRGDARHW